MRKKYSEDLKRGMVDRFIAGESATALAEETGILGKFVYQWKDEGWGTAGQAKRPAEPSDDETREIGRLKKRVEDLERLTGRQAAERDFFAAALRSVQVGRPPKGALTGEGSIGRSKNESPRKA